MRIRRILRSTLAAVLIVGLCTTCQVRVDMGADDWVGAWDYGIGA